MQSLANYAAAIAPAQLRLPDNARFSVDGQRIAQTTTSLAPRLLKPSPATIVEISKVSDSVPSAIEFFKTYQKPSPAKLYS